MGKKKTPWTVKIYATVTTEIEEESRPTYAASMVDAVDDALDIFRMSHESDKYRIEKVEAFITTDHDEQGSTNE